MCADDQVDRLILELGDPIPSVRVAAGKRLLSMRQAARAALARAAQSSYPEIAARARELLRDLPWDTETDPASIRPMLETYGKQTVFGRSRIVRLISEENLPDGVVARILVRLMGDDQDEMVRWAISGVLRGQRDRTTGLELLRGLNVDQSESAAMVGTVGWAWSVRDLTKATPLLKRAVELLGDAPLEQPSTADFVFETLIQAQCAGGQFDEAARICRRWQRVGAAGEQQDERSEPLTYLFSLHARYGPLEGFGADLGRYFFHLTDVEVLYDFAALARREMGYWAGRPLEILAMAAGGFTQQRHYRAGAFLLRQGWIDQAENEFGAVLALDDFQHPWYLCNAHFRLASIRVSRHDDLGAARHYESALRIIDHSAGPRGAALKPGVRTAIEIDMHWRFLRAREELDRHMEALLRLAPRDAVIATDLVPALKERGRMGDAERVFENVYHDARVRLEKTPTAGNQNELAWLCARCGEHLSEALELANEAIATDPDNGAFLDTAAEIHFRLGHRKEAIDLETRAVGLRPDDAFLKVQLKRFEEGK